MTVGGSARIWGNESLAVRASKLPNGLPIRCARGEFDSGLADFLPDDLVPFYERAEWEIGVAGEALPQAHGGPWARGYPMPPVASSPQRERLAQRFPHRGLEPLTPRSLLNSGSLIRDSAVSDVENAI